MHDLHVADLVLKVVIETSKTNKFSQVSQINLELGTVIEHGAAINPENLQFNIGMLARGTVAEKAEVTIKEVSGNNWKLISIKGE